MGAESHFISYTKVNRPTDCSRFGAQTLGDYGTISTNLPVIIFVNDDYCHQIPVFYYACRSVGSLWVVQFSLFLVVIVGILKRYYKNKSLYIYIYLMYRLMLDFKYLLVKNDLGCASVQKAPPNIVWVSTQ